MQRFTQSRGIPPAWCTPAARRLVFNGVLLGTVHLARPLIANGPPDQVSIYRDGTAWAILTVRRSEWWSDESPQQPASSRVRVTAERLADLDDLQALVRARWGAAGWCDLLDATRTTDPDLWQEWAPIQIERDLAAATFHRPDLARRAGRFSGRELGQLHREIADHLGDVGFEITEMVSPPATSHDTRDVAHALVRRYGFEAAVIIRIDILGEVVMHLADDDDDVPSPSLRQVDDG